MVVITISGLTGSGSSTVAKLLADNLKLDYFSLGKIFKKQSQQKTETLKAIEVWKSKGKDKNFHQAIDELQRDVAKQGNVVIDSKLSVFILKNMADFRVWLKASKKVRIERIAKRDNISAESASSLIQEKEEQEIKNWKRIYNINFLLLEYDADVSIDTSIINPEEIVNKIIRLMPK